MKALHGTKIRVRLDEDNEVEVRIKSAYREDELPMFAWLDAAGVQRLIDDLTSALVVIS